MRENILTAIKKELIVADGGMGSQLCAKGANPGECLDYLTLTKPELVAQVHQEFLEAGARLIETNTFGANPFKLARYGLKEKAREINRKGALIASECAGDNAWVAGAVGPLGRVEGRVPKQDEIAAAVRNQVEGLLDGGVDLIALETFSSLKEILQVLHIVREITDIPVMAQLVFDADGKTIEGDPLLPSLARLREKGADIVGANCGLGPKGFCNLLRDAALKLDCPVSAFPNAGYPEKHEDRLIFTNNASYYGPTASAMVHSGVQIIGGCCGTTPEHIRSLADAMKGMKPADKQPVDLNRLTLSPLGAIKKEETRNLLTEKSNKQKIIVELDPPKHLDVESVLKGAEKLRDAGVDFISIAENPLGVTRLCNITLSHMIRERIGMETIIHLTGRDRNLIGMQSALMGMAATGQVNVLAVTGDPPSSESGDKITGVFDMRSYELISLLSKMNSGLDFKGGNLKRKAGFAIGGALNPNTKNIDFQIRRMEKKIELGAQYFQTQPVYTREKIDLVAEKTRHLNVPVYLGILPLVSSRNAEFLHHEFPGITIPEEVRKRMKQAGDKGIDEGIQIASELIEYAAGKFDGIFIMPPFNKHEIALKLIEKIH